MNKTNRSKNTGSKNRNDKTTLFDVYSTTTEGNTLGLGKYLGFVMATDITGAMNASGEKLEPRTFTASPISHQQLTRSKQMRFTNGTLNMVYNAAAARKHFGNLKRDNNVCDHIGRDWEGCLYACVSKRTMTLWCLWG